MERIAFIEVNNYVAKILIVESKANAYFNVVFKRVVPIGLYEDFDKDHFFKRPQIDATMNILKQFKQACNMYGVEKTHTIGTFPVEMEPKNLNSFIDEVYTRCGFKLDYCENDDQDNYMYKACLGSVDSNKAFACLLEQDCLRFVQYNRRGVVNSKAYSFGPATLLNTFSKDEYPDNKARLEAIDNYIDMELSSIEWTEEASLLKFIGIGRYFDDLSKMVRKYKKYPLDRAHLFEMSIEDMDHIITQVLAMEFDETKKIKGLDDGRLDLFMVALSILKKIFEKFSTKSVVVSKNGVLEGRILEKSIVLNQEKPVVDLIECGVSGAVMNLDEHQQQHSTQVAMLCGKIFRELKVVHKLPKGFLKVLKVAGGLHDIGYTTNYFKHSSHSAYAILHKEVLGLTHREQVLASFVASLHHGEDIDLSLWLKYQSLFEPDDDIAVKKLGVMLRLAECFDSSMTNTITEIHCDILGDSVIFKTESEIDKSYELEEAREVGKAFEQMFKKRLEIL